MCSSFRSTSLRCGTASSNRTIKQASRPWSKATLTATAELRSVFRMLRRSNPYLGRSELTISLYPRRHNRPHQDNDLTELSFFFSAIIPSPPTSPTCPRYAKQCRLMRSFHRVKKGDHHGPPLKSGSFSTVPNLQSGVILPDAGGCWSRHAFAKSPAPHSHRFYCPGQSAPTGSPTRHQSHVQNHRYAGSM